MQKKFIDYEIMSVHHLFRFLLFVCHPTKALVYKLNEINSFLIAFFLYFDEKKIFILYTWLMPITTISTNLMMPHLLNTTIMTFGFNRKKFKLKLRIKRRKS